MGGILKTLFCVLLALIMLVVILPLLWMVIKEASALFGGAFVSTGSDMGYLIFTIICIFFIIWAIATWNS
jgi:phosphate starvation-inducible membrane PsiE